MGSVKPSLASKLSAGKDEYAAGDGISGFVDLRVNTPTLNVIKSLKFQMQHWDLWPFCTLEKTPTSQASIRRHPSTTTGMRNTNHQRL